MEVKTEDAALPAETKKPIISKIMQDFEEDDDNVFDKSILFHSLIENNEEKPKSVNNKVQNPIKKDPGVTKKRKFFKKGSNSHDVCIQQYPYSNNSFDEEFDPKNSNVTRIDVEFDDDKSAESNNDKKRVKIGNVKSYHEMLEMGEFEEFNYDIGYAVDGIQSPISSIRCLSVLNLATKCLMPSFRMHLRAYGNLSKIFKMLDDSSKDLRLSLCTATALFVLSQDNLNTDLDEDYLKLLINLLDIKVENDVQTSDICFKSTYGKVVEICRRVRSQGYGEFLDFDNLNPNQIAVEILLTIGGKKINDWFKNDVRQLGGFEPILVCMQNSLTHVPDKLRDSITFVRSSLRYVKLLENLTWGNSENSNYIYKFNNGIMVEILLKLFYQSSTEIISNHLSQDNDNLIVSLRDLVMLTLKILINIKDCYNDEMFVNELDGFEKNFVSHCLQFLFDKKSLINDHKRFELNVLVLILLINLIEKNPANKTKLATSTYNQKPGLQALIDQFYYWENCTDEAETNTKDFLTGKTTSATLSQSSRTSEDHIIEETLSQLLQRAGTHMEFTFLCAFVSILLGFMMIDDDQYSVSILQMLRDKSVQPLITMLQKFYDFIKVAGVSHLQNLNEMYFKTTEMILSYFYKCQNDGNQNG